MLTPGEPPDAVRGRSKPNQRATTIENGTQNPSEAPPTDDRRRSTLQWEDRFKEYLERRHASLALPEEGVPGEDNIIQAECEAEKALMLDTPAPNDAALLIKLRMLFRGDEDWHPRKDFIAAIGADVRRLYPVEVGHGD